MAKKNIADLTDDINTVLDQVDPGSISPAELKTLFESIRDSFVNRIDHLTLLGLRKHDENRAEPYVADEMAHLNGALHINRSGSQGALSTANFLQITPGVILYDLPLINGSQSFDQYELVRYENRAFQKLNNNSAWDVYDEFEFDQLNVPLGYYGEDWIGDGIYKDGMVVKATVGGREVYLRNNSVEPMRSTDISAEWIAGNWDYVADAKEGGLTALGATKTLDATDHGKTFYVEAQNSTVSIPIALPDGFNCRFVSYDTSYVDFVEIGGSLASNASGHKRLAGYGQVKYEQYAGGFRKITGDLISDE